MKIIVIGGGAWGTALAASAAGRHAVTLWARDAAQAREMAAARENRRYLPGVALPPALAIAAASDLAQAAAGHDLAIIATPMAGLRATLQALASHGGPLAWLCKGFEAPVSTPHGLLGHEVQQQVAPQLQAGVLSGPSFALEVARGQPTALVAASGKCLEGVPGMGFVFLRKAILDGCAGRSQSLAMDLHDQYVYMEKTGQWRFTPPTHVVVALAEAIAQFEEEGGQPARLARYTRNYQTLVHGMARLGFMPFLDPSVQAPIIVTFHAPGDARYDFKAFYAAARARGFLLYPGKLTQVETFRVGCIGAIGSDEMEQAVHAVALALEDMGIASGEPAI